MRQAGLVASVQLVQIRPESSPYFPFLNPEDTLLSLCVEAPLGSAKLYQIIKSVHIALTKSMHLTTRDVLIVRLRRYPGVH